MGCTPRSRGGSQLACYTIRTGRPLFILDETIRQPFCESHHKATASVSLFPVFCVLPEPR